MWRVCPEHAATWQIKYIAIKCTISVSKDIFMYLNTLYRLWKENVASGSHTKQLNITFTKIFFVNLNISRRRMLLNTFRAYIIVFITTYYFFWKKIQWTGVNFQKNFFFQCGAIHYFKFEYQKPSLILVILKLIRKIWRDNCSFELNEKKRSLYICKTF